MKKEWVTWAIVAGIVVLVLVVLNYQSRKNSVPLGDIFPQEGSSSTGQVEYEFVTDEETAQVPAAESVPAASQPAVAAAAAVPTVSGGPYVIQAASLSDKVKAEAALKKAVDAGLAGYVATVDLKEKGTRHRVYLGPYESQDKANAALPKAKAVYKDSFVMMLK